MSNLKKFFALLIVAALMFSSLGGVVRALTLPGITITSPAATETGTSITVAGHAFGTPPGGSALMITVKNLGNLTTVNPTASPMLIPVADTAFTSTAVTAASLGIADGTSVTVEVTAELLGAIPPTSTTMTFTWNRIVPAVTLVSIAVTPNPANIFVGGTQQFVATGTYSDASTANITGSVTWSANAPAGLFTGTAVGSFPVTATLGAIVGSATVNVTVPPIATLVSIAVTPNPANIQVGNTQQFVATGTYSNATTANITSSVTWSANAPAGLFTGTAVGSFPVTATLGAISGSATVNVTVLPPVGTMTGSITDTAKVLTLNYFNPVPVPPTAGTPVALASQYIYKMGDVIHGTVTFGSVVAGQLYTVQLKNMNGTVVDTVSGYQIAGLYTYPIQIGTANVSFDGPYDVVVGDANESISLPVGKHVFIQYNLTWKTNTIKNCSGFNTIEGWITRGNGQTVLVPVTVGITYPDNTLAATYVVAGMSSGQFSLTFPVNPATQIGQYRVFMRDGYDVGVIPDNDAMIYQKLGNIPAALAITAATYGSPILLYKSQAGQPVVISVIDNNGAPVSGAVITALDTYGVSVMGSYSMIAPGYYKLLLNSTSAPDVRIQAAATIYAQALTTNMIIIGLREKSAFNPYLDINVSQSPWFDANVGRYVYDTLPCTIGSGLTIAVGSWPVADPANWHVKSTSVTVNGPVRKIATGHYVITGAGKITASISMTVWERIDQTCPTWNSDTSHDVIVTNACCHTYTKNFDVCEVKSCVTVGVTVDGVAITDASTITDGKTADLIVNVTNPNTVPGLFCGCNTKIVKIYMVDGAGNIITDAFSAKTWGGATVDVTELWYNGIVGSVGMWNPDHTVQFKAGSDTTLGINVIDNCEKLTFKDVTFNVSNSGDCDYHLVTEVFGLYRAFDACGIMQNSYPFISETIDDISTNAAITTLTATATVFELGLDPTDILAGVPATIEITDPKFSISSSTVTWNGVTWTATLAGVDLGDLGITMTVTPTNTGYKFTFSCAFPMAGDLVITGSQYNADCSLEEVVTFTLKVVMPTFDVKIGLLDGSKIDNDHIITTGFGELIYVTATDPRSDGHHDFSTDTTWTLKAEAVYNACGLPTSVVCFNVPAGCTTPSPIQVYGYDNPHIEDAPQFELYFVVGGCADLLVDTFTLTDSTVKVTPTDVAFTIPASATHLVFAVKDAHTHGAPGVSVQIMGTTNSSGASGYSFVAGAAKTDKNGEADWAFVPPYSGQYTVGATFPTVSCALPCGWTGISASAKITASYRAPEVDITAPFVKVSDGIDGKTFTAAKLALTGKVTDNIAVTQLFVGMNKVDVLPDGTFMTYVMLAEGENTIAIVAYDAAGNKGTQTIKVTYAPAVNTSTALVLTIGADIVSVNGKATSIDAAPEIVASRTFVPIRFIAESFGATVEWLPETQGITITLGDHTIGLQIGNATAVIDGTIVSLSAAPYIKNGRTMVPLRVISEAFGGDVVWDPTARTITITYVP